MRTRELYLRIICVEKFSANSPCFFRSLKIQEIHIGELFRLFVSERRTQVIILTDKLLCSEYIVCIKGSIVAHSAELRRNLLGFIDFFWLILCL